MNETRNQEILALNQSLLDAIAFGDWQTYVRLCDSTLTAFEPEACQQLVVGLEFHRFYFPERPRTEAERRGVNNTMASPHVRWLGEDVAVVCYVRLVQKKEADGGFRSSSVEETRIWQKQPSGWKHVHFHRSTPS
jgi:ketosteroid isomerase-like protein